MAVKPFSNEELNFFKFSSIVFNEFPKAVRHVFVTLWDSKIAVLPGFQDWDDSTAVRNMLHIRVGGKTSIPINKSIDEWDCTALFQATIYAKIFGPSSGKGPTKTLDDLYLKMKKRTAGSFHPSVTSPTGNQDETYALVIDQIRLLRNNLCHMKKSEIAKADFDQFVQLAKDALAVSGVNTISVDAIGGLTDVDFPTVKVNMLRESFKKELQAMNDFLQGDTRDKICEMYDSMKISGNDLPDEAPTVSNTTRFSQREIHRLSTEIISHWQRLAGLLNIPKHEIANIIMSHGMYPQEIQKATQMLNLYNHVHEFSRENIAKCLDELGLQDVQGKVLSGILR